MACFCVKSANSRNKSITKHQRRQQQQTLNIVPHDHDASLDDKNHQQLSKYIEQNRRGLLINSSCRMGPSSGQIIDAVYDGGALKNIKILLLGAGESGKSTIARQMKMMHTSGYTDSERLSYVPIIFSNILTSLHAIFDKINSLDVSTNCCEEIKCVENYIDQLERAGNLIKGVSMIPKDICQVIKVILMDNKVKQFIINSHRYGISDSASYFFDNFQRITSQKYIPSVDDIIRSRVKTVGIYEIEFIYKSFKFNLIDVGGQKSERRKWIYCFQDCDMVLFVASLNDYCNTMEEDSSTNRLDDSLNIFQTLLANKIFKKTTFVLILNKSDLFKRTIKVKPLSSVFPNYKGDDSFQDSCDFILNMFLHLNTDENRYIYHHITCATDSMNVEFVFRSVADSLIKEELNMI